MKLSVCCLLVALLASPLSAAAQMASSKTAATSAPADVPKLVKFSGTATDQTGKPITGVVGVTFSLYKDQEGGAPLWIETQNVQADANGHYTAMLGANTSSGVPLEIFSSAEAHWVGTQISGQRERQRVLLLSVPYALKAADAETLGGLPASAFVHAAPNGAIGSAGAKTSSSASTMAPAAGVTGKGTKNYIPIWTGATSLGNSAIFQSGGNVGIGTAKPTAKLESVSSAGDGILGIASGSGNVGVVGTGSSSSGVGVAGGGGAFGVIGTASTDTNGAAGMSGQALGGSSQVYGVLGKAVSTQGTGVAGIATSTSGNASGVLGVSASPSGNGVAGSNSSSTGGNGVSGSASATSGAANGVYGQSASADGSGVLGNATSTSGNTSGVLGISASPSGDGVIGVNNATSGYAFGVQGISASPSGIGVHATNTSTGGTVDIGGTQFLVNAFVGKTGMFNVDYSGNTYIAGNLNVTGNLTKGGGSFKIDHPLDPANKYLSHSFVESPDIMNVYNGNVTTDRHGLATVVLPDYFDALNGDFRYQLTVMGKFAQAIVAQEIANNRFVIRTSKPDVKVSWQVTGIRHDAYANAYRIPTEEDKPAAEQGYYLHPEVFGQPASKSIQAASQKASGTEQLAKMTNQ